MVYQLQSPEAFNPMYSISPLGILDIFQSLFAEHISYDYFSFYWKILTFEFFVQVIENYSTWKNSGNVDSANNFEWLPLQKKGTRLTLSKTCGLN